MVVTSLTSLGSDVQRGAAAPRHGVDVCLVPGLLQQHVQARHAVILEIPLLTCHSFPFKPHYFKSRKKTVISKYICVAACKSAVLRGHVYGREAEVLVVYVCPRPGGDQQPRQLLGVPRPRLQREVQQRLVVSRRQGRVDPVVRRQRVNLEPSL